MKLYLEGNLRIYEADSELPGTLLDAIPGSKIVGETAFGLQFVQSHGGTISVYDPETRALQDTGCGLDDFIAAVEHDADDLIDQELYVACVTRFGRIGQHEHFAFVREIALGGAKDATNVEVLDAATHMAALLALSSQIVNAGSGAQIRSVR